MSHDVPRDISDGMENINKINGHVPPPSKAVSIVREEVVKKEDKEDRFSDFGFVDDTHTTLTPAKAKSKARKSASRLPSDWTLPAEWLDIAAKIGLSEETARAEADNMRDWSLSAPGGAKLDWLAAWRNWCRRKANEVPKASALQRQFPKTALEIIREQNAKRKLEDEHARSNTH